MKAWKKGAIVGALWGIVSLPIWLFLGFESSSSATPYPSLSVGAAELLTKIFAFPLWFGYLISDSIPVQMLLSMLIGALIGAGLGYLIDNANK